MIQNYKVCSVLLIFVLLLAVFSFLDYSSLPVSKFPPTKPDIVIPKATSRSQLEAARTRFFAELMQNSELFKDSPSKTLTLSSESLGTSEKSSTPPEDPFKKYSRSPRNNNNTSMPSLEESHSGSSTPPISNAAIGKTVLAHSTPDISESSA